MDASLAEIIRARRIVRGMDRRDLAAAVGCDVRTVRRWECGSQPHTRHIPALREALDIPLKEMDRIVIRMLRERSDGLQIEGPEFLTKRGHSYSWLVETLLEMDRRLIASDPTASIQDANRWIPVFQALPDTWRLLTIRDKIVGNWQFLPLAPGVHDEICAGRLTEADLSLDHLVCLDLPGELDIYISALVVEPAYRQGQGLVMLFRSLSEKLNELSFRGIRFQRVSAIAWTPQSRLLCKRLGMQAVRNFGIDSGTVFATTMDRLNDPLRPPSFNENRRTHAFEQGCSAPAMAVRTPKTLRDQA